MARSVQQAAPSHSTTTRADIAAIERLPIELIRYITSDLELQDICSLRQTCRILAQYGAVGPFEDALKSRRLRLSENGLRHFIQGLSISPRMHHVQNLTIEAKYDSIEVKLTDDDGDWSMPDAAVIMVTEWQWKNHVKVVTMLHEVIEHLAKVNHRCFQCIELVAEPHPSWEHMIFGNHIMPRATRDSNWLSPLDAPTVGQQQQQVVELMFAMVRDTLQHAEASCSHLVLFSAVRGCNLDYNSWTNWLHSAESEVVLRHAKSVSLRVKTPNGPQRLRHLDPEVADLLQLQQIARQLQSYHVHWFRLPHDTPLVDNDHVLRHMSLWSLEMPTHLTSCTLQGIISRDCDLLAFFQHNPGLQELRLERPIILLADFKVKDIFNAIQTQLKDLEYLAISSMWASGLIHFNEPAPLLPWQTDRVDLPPGVVDSVENLERCGSLAHAPISWTIHQPMSLGCRLMMSRAEAANREFG